MNQYKIKTYLLSLLYVLCLHYVLGSDTRDAYHCHIRAWGGGDRRRLLIAY